MNTEVIKREDGVPRVQLFNCAYAECGATFTRQWRLQEHETVHTGARPHKCGVVGCGRSFTRKSHLNRHTSVHSGVKRFRCNATACGKKNSKLLINLRDMCVTCTVKMKNISSVKIPSAVRRSGNDEHLNCT